MMRQEQWRWHTVKVVRISFTHWRITTSLCSHLIPITHNSHWLCLHLYIPTLYWVLWVKVLRPTRQKIGHFGHVPEANLLAWNGKTKPNTTKAQIHQSKECTTTQNKHKKLKPGLVASHNIWPGNRGPSLVSALYKFVTYLLRCLPIYLQPWTHTGL